MTTGIRTGLDFARWLRALQAHENEWQFIRERAGQRRHQADAMQRAERRRQMRYELDGPDAAEIGREGMNFAEWWEG